MSNISVQLPKYEILKEETSFDYIFKIIIIGDSCVGKSCLTLRACKNEFESCYTSTVGYDFFKMDIKINDKKINLQIWDTCGQEKFRSLISNFYRNSSLAIIVYSIDNQNSYNNIGEWLNEIRELTNPDIKIFLIGNKSDLANYRKISKQKAKSFCDENGLDYFTETSAKNGENVEKTFAYAAYLLMRESIKQSNKNIRNISEDRTNSHLSFNFVEDEPSNLILDGSSTNHKSKCCS